MDSSPSNYDKSVSIVSKCTVIPDSKSSMEPLRLSVSDLPFLSTQYIQKGCLFSAKSSSSDESIVSLLKYSLSKTLSVFPPLSGRLSTDSVTGHVSVTCSDAGALFIHARASSIVLSDLLNPNSIPLFRPFFALNGTLNFDGHTQPIVAVQVTFLGDGVFIGCSINHTLVDGTSFWHFFNTFAQISRGETKISISRPPCFSRNNVFCTDFVIRFPGGRPAETFPDELTRLRERVFHFSRGSILEIKKRANETLTATNGNVNGAEISSFLSLCAILWRSIIRARNLPPTKTTTFYLPINCRERVNPKLSPVYFGNAVQVNRIVSLAGELVTNELGWSGDLLRRSVVAHDDETVRRRVEERVRVPQCTPRWDLDVGRVIMGSSPRFPMYDNDFGWGPPVTVRSGRSNKPNGKITAFPGPEGDGSVEFEVVLAPETMARLEVDSDFIQYVT